MTEIVIKILVFIAYWFVADWAFDFTLFNKPWKDKRVWFLLLAPNVMHVFL